MFRFLLRLVLPLGLVLLAACASSPDSARNAPSVLPPADPIGDLIGRPEYRIGPNDLLAISVFQVPDLDREVRVNNAGQITLPLIGAVDVAGQTVGGLEELLAGRYAERYLQNPQVNVFIREFTSQRVTVGGEVGKPGIYPMTASRMTLVQALALADGFTDVASRSNVFVFRTVDGQRHVARFDVAAIQDGLYPDPELSGEDVVIVDTSAGRQTLKYLIQLTPFVAVWRYYR